MASRDAASRWSPVSTAARPAAAARGRRRSEAWWRRSVRRVAWGAVGRRPARRWKPSCAASRK
ncbi:hypothetical protein KCP70_07170 [Salmonella enterica subsp. enterica]|nr:hypothetical protein KCP70_07170 [Salmonella enterica subsp. enterica]